MDYLASQKINTQDNSADNFLNTIEESKKSYFNEYDKDKKYSPYLNADLLSKYDDENGGYYLDRFRHSINYGLRSKKATDGINAAIDYGKALLDNPSKTLEDTSKALSYGMASAMDCTKELDCLKESAGTLYFNLSERYSPNYWNKLNGLENLYGYNVHSEAGLISTVRNTNAALEFVPFAKAGSAVVKGMRNAGVHLSHNIGENLARGNVNKLGEKYAYADDGIFVSSKGAKVINTGAVDKVTGNSVYQRMDSSGKPYDSYFMISNEGAQIVVNKPDNLKNLGDSTISINAINGKGFESEIFQKYRSQGKKPEREIILETESGVRTRIDLMMRDGDLVLCVECKSSMNAPLTKNQKIAFPEIEKTGAVVISKGSSTYPKGTVIPPTKVIIERK